MLTFSFSGLSDPTMPPLLQDAGVTMGNRESLATAA